MSTLQEYVKRADDAARIAHHLITQTFPLSSDPKVLLSVLKNIHISHENIFLAVLDNEFLRPKISPNASFILKLDRLKQLVTEKKLLEPKELSVLVDVENDWNRHNSSDVEFARNDDLVMADSEEYLLKKLTSDLLQDYISRTKIILKKLFKV